MAGTETGALKEIAAKLNTAGLDDINTKMGVLKYIADNIGAADGSGGTVTIVDDLVTGGRTSALSAEQGKVLNMMIIPTDLGDGLIDLNNIVHKGHYIVGGIGGVANAPAGVNAAYSILTITEYRDYIRQELVTPDGSVYTRLIRQTGAIMVSWAKKITTLDIINDLTFGGIEKPLAAEQGKVIKGLIDALEARVAALEA